MIFSIIRRVSLISKYPTLKEGVLWQLGSANFFHTNSHPLCEKSDRQVAKMYFFEQKKEKKRDTYLDVVVNYRHQTGTDRGYVDFINSALKYMDEFGVNKDLHVYKTLVDILPKGKYIPTNHYQKIAMHYPEQQFVILRLLCKMEENTVLPDPEMQDMLLNIFGEDSLVLKKFWRMVYWMSKFYHLNPWKAPDPLPSDPRALSKFAMWKISSDHIGSNITEFNTKDVEDAIEDTWIVSVMSKTQAELLKLHDVQKSLFIEGPYNVWVANQAVDYFVLRGDPIKREVVEIDTDDVSDIKIPFWETKYLGIPVTPYEQEDGVYFATCATGSSSKDSLLSWIRCLEKENPKLKDIPIVFKLRSAIEDRELLESEKRQIEDKDLEDASLEKT